MKNLSVLKFFLIAIFWYSGLRAVAQDATFNLVPSESKMSITGTSSLHDWTSQVKQIDGSVVMPTAIANNIPKRGDKFKNVNFIAVVKSIDSGRGATMDNRTYASLKAEEHPEIKFEMTDSEVTGIVDLKAGKFEALCKGNLNIAGTTKPIEMKVQGQRTENGQFKFSGNYKLKMTDFNIKPPTAMFGQIVTGDEVSVDFDLAFAK